MSTPAALQAFITKWELSGAAERANAQLFLAELCDVLEVQRPQPKTPTEADNAYVFEKPVPSTSGTTNFIDLYKRGCFVLETKQGVDAVDGADDAPLSAAGEQRLKERKAGHGKRGTKGFDTAMIRAQAQAQRYARALPKEEIPDGRPPFVVVVDVGHSISLYTDWSRMGGEYLPFPDPASYRIPLKGLLDAKTRETLRSVWTEPLTLDPARRSAKVTREIADRLAKLAKTLEGKHDPEHVAAFLMRCLFTMFSEDVELLPLGSFTKLLGELKGDPENFQPMLENLWGTMNTGGLSPILRKKLPRFNGGLFAHADAIALNADQIQLLIEASTANWRDVEPAIFGTLLERALDPRERHKLGAHYTPRAYVERLVNPTVIEPLREQWKGVQVAALQLHDAGDDKKAIKLVEDFLHQLATVRVLDPACGSGNFLYVTLELLKRLEGEVLNTLHELGTTSKLELEGVMVTPANFFGIELNPRAAAIAEQVLWIGFLQWHLRTHGHLHNLPEPIIKDLHNIECRDAVLAYDARTELRDADGHVVTKWDGRTTKPHPVTGQEVPDADAREPVYTYTKPRPAQWPEADYIVGNPPFVGDKRMKDALGEGYALAIREAYSGIVPSSCDFVMFWWQKAAALVSKGAAKRFGLISTNSVTQKFNRRVIEDALTNKKPISLAFAIPDHPWVDSADGAAVRIAMTVGVSGTKDGLLSTVVHEEDGHEEVQVKLSNTSGKVHPDLTVGANTTSTVLLQSNDGLACNGVQLSGMGFAVERDRAVALGLGSVPSAEKVIRRYRNGKDLMASSRDVFVIDFFGLAENEARERFPSAYQHVLQTVKPERDQNNRETYRRNWWIFAEPRGNYRPALEGISRYVATCRTAKHRTFTFLDADIVHDAKVVAIAVDDAYFLGILSSELHVAWAQSTGGWLGVGNDSNYNHSECFVKFPFPACTPAQQEKIRALGEQLDAHRKRQQALHSELTMTGMYNVLEAVRAGTPLNAKEKKTYEQGLVGILKQLHDELDAAVAEAYGWPAAMSTDEILAKLVALNAERAAEEAQGHVRWLRPEYQMPGAGTAAKGKQAKLEIAPDPAPPPTSVLRDWPNELPAQAAALAAVLEEMGALCTVQELAAHFIGKATPKRLREMEQLLNTLAAVGRARQWKGKWAGA
ncbi:MAG: type IIL restriction-modification enzyme MmeI [Flavobacteriales bacterium]